jgi:hypothetical protein
MSNTYSEAEMAEMIDAIEEAPYGNLTKTVRLASTAIGSALEKYVVSRRREKDFELLRIWFTEKLKKTVEPTHVDDVVRAAVDAFFEAIRVVDKRVVDSPDELQDAWESMAESEYVSEIVFEYAHTMSCEEQRLKAAEKAKKEKEEKKDAVEVEKKKKEVEKLRKKVEDMMKKHAKETEMINAKKNRCDDLKKKLGEVETAKADAEKRLGELEKTMIKLGVTVPSYEPKPTPSGSTPSEATPSEATPSEETPSEETPSEATPSEATPSEATPSEATPSESTPSEPTSDPPDEVASDSDDDEPIRKKSKSSADKPSTKKSSTKKAPVHNKRPKRN